MSTERDIEAQIRDRRADTEFMERLREHHEQDAAVYERLARGEHVHVENDEDPCACAKCGVVEAPGGICPVPPCALPNGPLRSGAKAALDRLTALDADDYDRPHGRDRDSDGGPHGRL
jgi:hypothetical protein